MEDDLQFWKWKKTSIFLKMEHDSDFDTALCNLVKSFKEEKGEKT